MEITNWQSIKQCKKMKNKNLLITAVVIFAFATISNAQVPSYVSTNGLVGWWPFNGNANDESGNGINGNPIGAVLTTDRFGNQNSAYSFNGSSNVINCGNSTNPNLTLIGDFTFSAWINASCFGCNNYANMILSKHRFGSPNGYCFGLWNGGMINYAGTPNFDASTYPAGQSGYLITNVWKNIIVVYESASTSLKYYIDGTLVDNKLLGFNMASNLDDLVFGAQRNGAATGYLDYFSGKIDDIGIWNIALTQEAITNLYNSQISPVSLLENTFIDNPKVYPNPNSGNFTVDIGQVSDKVDVTVLDLQGRIVLQKVFTQTQLFQMNLNDSAGIYVVSVASEKGKSLLKIIIE
jgi:hypothetical protein